MVLWSVLQHQHSQLDIQVRMGSIQLVTKIMVQLDFILMVVLMKLEIGVEN